jgi:hypothetical protein
MEKNMMLLNKMLLELKEDEFVRVPIKSLDGVKCMVNFRERKGYMFDVDIVYRYGNKNEEGHQRIRHKIKDKEMSIFGLKEAINEINNIKFSKKNNEFVFEEQTYEELFTSNNYETFYEDCTVCLEKTVRKTSCNHCLCLPCYIKIKKTCPICRKNIKMDKVDKIYRD